MAQVYFQHGDKIRTKAQRLPGWHYGALMPSA